MLFRSGAKIRLFILDGVPDITSEQEARAFHDLLLRVISNAKQRSFGGKLYLSLACGRKTMSTDMQDAAYCFGCDMLLHVLGDNTQTAQPMLMGAVARNEAINLEPQAFADEEVIRFAPKKDYLERIEEQKHQSQHFFTSYYLNEKETRSNFHILYTLPPSKIEQLKSERLGVTTERQERELEWLKRLPKCDLHCHLGGVLNIEQTVETASYFQTGYMEGYAKDSPSYCRWLHGDRQSVFEDFLNKGWKKSVRESARLYNVPQVCISSPLLSIYSGREDELKNLWYGMHANEREFCGVGIERYEQLGDLQGSTLLDSLQTLEYALDVLLKRCESENVKYLELRCSPLNYTTKKISGPMVVKSICNLLERAYPAVETSLIFIISRHRGNIVDDYVNLVKEMNADPMFKKYFRGFDLAGNESIKAPEELRQSFISIMRECYNITIHAGETESVESIWQAVYHLNAERIGHGLHLLDNSELLTKFLERGIAVEMCPSSNFQIVGYQDNYYPQDTANRPRYPLRDYLDKELKVCINTDDPGISQTDMTHELHKAARLTGGGLSKWDILQLICNGFRSAFSPYEQKKQLIRSVEKQLEDLIKKEWL